MVEAYLPVDEVMDYYGNKSTPIAHFPFNFEFITSIPHNITATKVYNTIQTWMQNLPEGAWPNWVVSNMLKLAFLKCDHDHELLSIKKIKCDECAT